MHNPWKPTAEDRAELSALLETVAGEILAHPEGEEPDPIARHWNRLIVLLWQRGEVELGVIFAATAAICRRGGEQGRDRILADVTNIAADYHEALSDPNSWN